MGLFGAMTASVSGLNAQGEAISVISDNLSNSNTVGYKGTRALFSQLVTSSGVGGTTYNAGGVKSNVLRSQSTQGSFISSTSKTDLALSGGGYFVVTDSATKTTETSTFYTRLGSFKEDKEGFLVTPSGHYLQGWKTDSAGNILNLQNPQSIELQSVGVSAQATTEVRIGANLTSTETPHLYNTTAGLTAAGQNLAAVVANPATADYVADVRMYDAQGGARDVSVAFVKRAANMWDWVAYTDGSNIEGGTAGSPVILSSGTNRFDGEGKLKHVTGSSFTVNWDDGVEPSTVALDFGDYKGGKVVTGTNAQGQGQLEFGQGILDINIEKETMAVGDYRVVIQNGTGEWRLTDAAGTTVLETITGVPTTAGVHSVVFPNTGVRITVDDSFNMTPGGYPNTIGDFTVGNIAGSGKATGGGGVVQLAASYNTSFVNQNGFGSGSLSSISVDENGFIAGTFTNGETKKLWKVSLGVFQNPDGLEATSGSLMRATDLSGQALLKQAGVGGSATIVSGSLEGSTVDIANEFSQMIVSQRAYQANSKVISTVDQMLNNLMQLR